MAQLHAGVRTGGGTPTPAHLAAAMRNDALVAVPLGVAELATEAEIIPGYVGVDALAPRTPPPPLFSPGCLGPLLDAVNVEDLKRKKILQSRDRLHLGGLPCTGTYL